MKVFYIPDGHRRFADQTDMDLVKSYELGFEVLVDEIIEPIFKYEPVDTLGIFLLSQLNLKRRHPDELNQLLSVGEQLLEKLVDRCSALASIKSHGTFLNENIETSHGSQKQLHLFIGSGIDDHSPIGEVDVFFRSGGEMRLSGAPRALIGSYTQLYVLDKLHPALTYTDINHILEQYQIRYMRECGQQRPDE